jgi:hypothetical protein
MYRGPSALLVWTNAGLCCFALVLLILLGVVRVTETFMGPGPTAMWSFLVFVGFSFLSYPILILNLLAACAMLVSRGIPAKVKAVTATVESVVWLSTWFLCMGKIGGLFARR